MKTIHQHRGAIVSVQLMWRPRARVVRLRVKSRRGVLVREFALRRLQRVPHIAVIARAACIDG